MLLYLMHNDVMNFPAIELRIITSRKRKLRIFYDYI